MKKTKLYCYVDETGQDGLHTFFLVSIVITDQDRKDNLENRLIEVEKKTGKNKTKWTKEEFEIRVAYIKEIAKINTLHASIFYSLYKDNKEYLHLTSLSIAKAVLAKGEKDYKVTVIVDGLTKKDTEKMRRDLKQLQISYSNIRGMKDEQSAFLRLADCMAGFIRDYREKRPYSIELFTMLKRRGILIETQ